MLLSHGDQRPQTSTPAVGDRSTATMQPQHTRLWKRLRLRLLLRGGLAALEGQGWTGRERRLGGVRRAQDRSMWSGCDLSRPVMTCDDSCVNVTDGLVALPPPFYLVMINVGRCTGTEATKWEMTRTCLALASRACHFEVHDMRVVVRGACSWRLRGNGSRRKWGFCFSEMKILESEMSHSAQYFFLPGAEQDQD
jgi:hypothetical protein